MDELPSVAGLERIHTKDPDVVRREPRALENFGPLRAWKWAALDARRGHSSTLDGPSVRNHSATASGPAVGTHLSPMPPAAIFSTTGLYSSGTIREKCALAACAGAEDPRRQHASCLATVAGSDRSGGGTKTSIW